MPVCTRINKVGKILGLFVVSIGLLMFSIEMLRVIYLANSEWFYLYDTALLAKEYGGAAFDSQHLAKMMMLMEN